LEKLVGRELIVDIHEVRKPELNAHLVAENIALQLERRVAFRRAMKKPWVKHEIWRRHSKGCRATGWS
jgi:ribosomal protein S3